MDDLDGSARYTRVMRLWIDVREACRERKTGKGQWALRCVSAVLARPDVEVTLLTDADVPSSWNGLPGLKDVRRIDATGWWWHLRAWRLLVKQRASVDVYVSPTSFIVPFLLGKNVRTVPVVHDLIAFRNEPHDRKATLIERFTLPRALRSAHAVCTVSDATADRVRGMFGADFPVVTVSAGPTTEEDRTWTGGGDHVLCISTLCPRKNQLRLIEAYASLPEGLRQSTRLVLVGGRGWDDEPIVRAAASTPGVTWMGFQDDASCKELLRTCTAFAFVSEEEGFGLPVLDALRVGAPVLASDIPTNREIAAAAAVYADPQDVGSIRRGLETVLGSGASLQAAGFARATLFSWEKTAERLVNACSAR